MSLDSDRSPDEEPRTPAGQATAPGQQAPATPERTSAPSFTPVWAAAKRAAGEPAATADEPAAGETAATAPTAGERAAAGPVAYEPGAHETTADEPMASEPVADEPVASEPVGAESVPADPMASETAADEPPASEPAASEPTASGMTTDGSGVAPARDGRRDGVAEVAADGPADRAADESADRAADGPADRAAGAYRAGVEPTADLDSPLLSDTDELRASWQRIQAAFVDDPRDAVADAAGLVEHTAQALVGALRQRQRQLRDMWDRDGLPDGVEYADSGSTAPGAASPDGDRQPAADGPDTEQLRLLIQRYRVLFNDLCRP